MAWFPRTSLPAANILKTLHDPELLWETGAQRQLSPSPGSGRPGQPGHCPKATARPLVRRPPCTAPRIPSGCGQRAPPHSPQSPILAGPDAVPGPAGSPSARPGRLGRDPLESKPPLAAPPRRTPAAPPRTSSFVTMFFNPVKQTVQLEPGPPASIFADV